MIRIAVIDDEKEMLDEICSLIQKTIIPGNDVEICPFVSAEELMEEINQGTIYNILFSDIELDGINGMELGRKIAEKYPRTYLVFITSFSEFAAESYLIDAYQYVLKQDMEQRIPDIVNQLVQKIRKVTKTYILVGTETNKQRICCEDIIYISKSKSAKYVEYFTVNGQYRERITLNQVMEKLQGKEFIVVERGYIVNMKYIVRMEENIIYLENNAKVAVSRARFAKVKQEINSYWRNEM